MQTVSTRKIQLLLINFKTKSVNRDKEKHFLVKGLVPQENMIIINAYVPNHRTSKFKQKQN